jgi:signal transduction histidine kinase
MARADGRAWPVIPGRVLDAGIALGVALLGVAGGLGAAARGGHAPIVTTAVLVAMGLILFPRRRFPGTVLALAAALVAALVVLNASVEGTFVAVLIASYSAAVHGGRRIWRVLMIAAPVTFLGLGALAALGGDGWLNAHIPVRTLIAAAGAGVVGLVIRQQFAARAEHMAVLAERAGLVAAQQEERARRATLAERLRIARELHDIVAHHLTVVVIQAQGAQRASGQDPDRARAAMADVERTGRTALDEMRHLLGLLRSGEPADEAGDAREANAAAPGAVYLPPFGLADIDDLAEGMRGAGLPVTLIRRGEPRDVPEDVGLTAYRIVQESLTNVLKHAGPAAATVELALTNEQGAAELGITVTDDGRGASAALDAVPGTGRGTTGLQERVAALGGGLSIGPRPGGGYRVHATIPLERT